MQKCPSRPGGKSLEVERETVHKAGQTGTQIPMRLGAVPAPTGKFGKHSEFRGQSPQTGVGSGMESGQLYTEHCWGPTKKITQKYMGKKKKKNK